MPKPHKHPKSPYWQYDFQRQGRRFHGSTGTKSKAAAQAYIDRLIAEIAAGITSKPELTLDQALGTYFETVSQHQSSAATTRSQIRALLSILKPGEPISEIGAPVLTDYARRRRARVSDSTVNRELQCLRRALRWCHSNLKVSTPDLDWPALMLREPAERTRALSSDEQLRLFEALREDLRPLAQFCLSTGIRLGGARSLTWDRVDLPGARVTIRIKGGRWETLPIPVSAVVLIANLPRVEGVAEVFTWQPRGGARRAISADGWRKQWANALNAANLPDFRFHDLRHSFATRWRRAGGDLFTLRRALSHKSLQSTLRYSHVDEQDIRVGLERIEEYSRNSPERGVSENK